MKATVPYIEKKFDQFNRQMFRGRLPRPPVVLADAKTFLGVCSSHTRLLPDGRKEHYDFRLRINTRIDLPEQTVEDTIIHEMIHYFIHYHGLEDSSAHGPVFRAIMDSINTAFHRHLTVTHRSTPEQAQQGVSSKPAWHVIAVIKFRDGRVGIKVVPRRVERILEFRDRLARVDEVEGVRFVFSDNTFFNRFPNSTALKYHTVAPDVLAENLRGADIIQVQGGDVKVTREKYQ